MHLVTLATDHGTVAQPSPTSPGQRSVLAALKQAEPPRYYEFTRATEPDNA